VVRHITGEFTDAYSPTIEDSYSTTLVVDRTHEYHLQVVDTSGQDELSLLPSSYVFNVDAYILVYSVMSLASFHVIQTIYQRLVSAAGLLTGRFPLVLVANKTDAADGVDTQREVSTDAGRSLAACWHAAYVETSASRGVNISRVFDLLGQRLKDADDGQFLMSTTGFNQRKKRWWRRFTCTASDTMS
jgi:Ras family protein